ncbi:MAG TPA: DinB family protein [Caulobacteraceae bacterium]|nr:DinB family protein [Caulobacteraceae bacterium]
MDHVSTLERLFRHKAQANREMLAAMAGFEDGSPAQEVALRTISHTWVVDRIFAGHLSGTPHGFGAANQAEAPSLATLCADVAASDAWFVDYVAHLAAPQLAEAIDFTFTDGAPGRMSREEMLMHLITHGCGHRGQVGWMMLEQGVTPPTDGLTTYLHTAEAAARRRGGAVTAAAPSQPAEVASQRPGAPPAAAAAANPSASRLEELTERMREAALAAGGLGKTLKFNLKGEGIIFIDGTAVTNEDRPADLTLTATIDDLAALGQGKLSPTSAIMTGRLRLSDMGVAVALRERMQVLFARMRPAA